MDPRFLSFVWRHSKRDQIIILLLTISSFPLVYASLEIPKMIVNQAISGEGGFPRSILGVQFGQVPYLLLLCAGFLALVVAINGIKWFLNIRVGITGERMLRRLRFMIFERVLLFRAARLRNTKPGEVTQAIVAEIEPLGGFIGEVISTPAFQGGLLLVYCGFIFVQDWILGLAAVALIPAQAWFIPILQKKLIRLNKQRALNTRKLADTISQTINLSGEVQTNNTARWHMAQVSARLYENTRIRLQIFERKFTIKFINNFLNQLTPFFFYAIGGYFVIIGKLDFGSLVAVLAAYKDVAAPWKEVLAYMQRWNDFNSRYVFVVEAFSGDDIAPPSRIYPEAADAQQIEGPLVFSGLEGGPGTGGLSVQRLEAPQGAMVAVAGGAAGGREALLKLAAGLQPPAEGQVTFAGKALMDCSMPQVGATVAYVGAEPGVISRPMRDNLLYGLLHGAPDLVGQTEASLMNMLREARLTGNPTAWPDGDWIDYRAAGVDGPAELDARLLHLIEVVGLSGDLYTNALDMRLDSRIAAAWTDPILRARRYLHESGPDLSDLVEDWRPDAFNGNARLLDNVLYALPVDPPPGLAGYADDGRVMDVLDRTGATSELMAIGWDIAREFADLLEALDDDSSSVLDNFQGYGRGEIKAAGEVVVEAVGKSPGELSQAQRKQLLTLAFGYVQVRDRMEVLGDGRVERLLACRAKARDMLRGRDDFVAFDEERFSPARPVAGNILHGQRRFDRKSQWKRLEEMMQQAIQAAGLRDDLIRLGLSADPAASGDLSSAARRRIALVRGIIKRPKLLVLDGVAGSDTEADAGLRDAIRAELPETTIVYAALEDGAAMGADLVVRIGPNGETTIEDCRPASAEPPARTPELAER